MRVFQAIGIVILVGAALQSGAVRSDDAKEFAPKNGMYTITIPAGVKSSERKQIFTIGKHKAPLEGSQSVSKEGTTFLGASIGIPAVLMREIPAEKRFDTLRDAFVEQLKGKVKDEKDVKQDPIPGKEYLIELPKGYTRLQIYTIAGWVIYVLVEGKDKAEVTSKQADDFFASLKMTDKAKDVFNKTKR
jgi:hypothetical protein